MPGRQRSWLILGLVLGVVLLVYAPSLSGQFLNWDDETHLTQHVPVRFLTWANLRQIYSTTVLKTYIPLTITSFVLEYHLFGYQPFFYRLDNLLLHLFVTAMVFFIGRQLQFSPAAAGAAALGFGIHPMHVESVAWISQRKDVLCASFYFLAIGHYGRWIQCGRPGPYVVAIICALASILAKPMAVSLPWALWVIDYYWQRKLSWRMVWDKLPFFAVIIPVALITLLGHERDAIEPGITSGLIWTWSYAFYLRQFFAPVVLLPLYDLPRPINITNPAYWSAIMVLLLSFGLLGKAWRDTYMQKGWLFFVATIFFLLRFRPDSGPNLVADRFMYIPSLGFCLWLGWMAEKIVLAYQEKRKATRWLAMILLAGLFMFWAGQTVRQCLIWKNSLSLWDHVIRYSSSQALAYNNRGSVYRQQGQWRQALQDLNRAIELKPDYSESYNNRGLVYLAQEDFSAALADQNQAIKLNPYNEKAYNNRGVTYASLGELDLALADYDQAVAIHPGYPEAYNNRAITYEKLGKDDLALSDYRKAIVLNPHYKDAYRNRGIYYLRRGDIRKAQDDLQRAQ